MRWAATFLVLNDSKAALGVLKELEQFLPIQNEADDDRIKKFFLEPMANVFLNGDDIENNALEEANASSSCLVYGFFLHCFYC